MAGAKNLRYVCVRAARTPGRALPSLSLWTNIYLNHQLPPPLLFYSGSRSALRERNEYIYATCVHAVSPQHPMHSTYRRWRPWLSCPGSCSYFSYVCVCIRTQLDSPFSLYILSRLLFCCWCIPGSLFIPFHPPYYTCSIVRTYTYLSFSSLDLILRCW